MKPADSRFHSPNGSDSDWNQTSDWTIVSPPLAVLNEDFSDKSILARFDRFDQDFLPESPGVVIVDLDHQISHSNGLLLIQPFLSADQFRNDFCVKPFPNVRLDLDLLFQSYGEITPGGKSGGKVASSSQAPRKCAGDRVSRSETFRTRWIRGVQETLFEQIVVMRPRKNPSGFTG